MTKENKSNWKCTSCLSTKGASTTFGSTSVSTPQTSRPASSKQPNLKTTPEDSNITTRKKTNNNTQNESSYVTESNLRDILKQEITAAIKSSIKELVMAELQSINQQIGSFHDAMTFFNQHFEDLKASLEEKSTHIKKLEEDNLNLKSCVNDLSTRLCLVEQQMRESNVEINGLPEKNSENLPCIITKLAKSVDCQIKDDDVLHVTRVAKLNKENPRPRTVVAKLRSTRHRDALIAAVSSYNRKNPANKLSTSHVGYDGPSSPVYVAEHLTPTNKSLHAEVRKKAKELSYKFVWVRNGRIQARKDEYSPILVIRNSSCLRKMN
ncbi:unnamed protein product [Plutella xylostella]|uniref:(diamondback moth) hypothetical protein n=1 Tax=Plutella xylostella TaxID=51655 RepID=A0A8S4G315_PLUXY|nr:unnamed protein product [Plutella xylostella]